MSEIRLCKDCKYIKVLSLVERFVILSKSDTVSGFKVLQKGNTWCAHPNLVIKHRPDYVSGQSNNDFPPCQAVREIKNGACGPMGKLWEAK